MTHLSRRNLSKLLLASVASLPMQPLFARDKATDEAEFQQWLKQQKADFNAFTTFYADAFNDYKEGIEVDWGANPVLRSQTLWVDYDDTVRRVVDFKRGFAEVTLLKKQAEPTSRLEKRAKQSLKQIFRLTKQQVLDQDKLEQAVSRRLESSQIEVVDSVSDKSERAPVFATVAPSGAVIEKAIAKEQKLPDGREIITIKVPIRNDNETKRAPFLSAIQKYADKYQLPTALLSAVAQAESAFNPLATSRTPAYGLMQIVPTSAGLDVAEYLYKQQKLFSPRWLYNAQNNVMAGSTYFHLLQSRYLKTIKHELNRLYASIASYNTGAGNMAKAFSKDGLSAAIVKINQIEPKAVFDQLIEKLPYQETKDYLKKVIAFMEQWQSG